MKWRIILLALGACLLGLSSLASADNLPLPPCCSGLTEGGFSIPSTAFTYQGVQPDPPDCCSVDPAVNPLVPYTFYLTYSQIDTTWYVTVEGPEYSFDPFDPSSAFDIAGGEAFSEWDNALYGGATEYEVGPDNCIVPVAPEPRSLALLLIGLGFLAVHRRNMRRT
jgi:hypothetical protein